MTYTYDAWSRLDTAQAGPNATPTWKYSYNYDRFGNRRNQNLIAGAQGYQSLLNIDPNTNRITGSAYDAAGNMTGDGNHTYAFDAENRIKTVDTTAAAYTYDGTNLRVKKWWDRRRPCTSTVKPLAVRLYTEGRARLWAFDFIHARDLLVQAIAVEPEFPLAHSALSDAWDHLGYDLKARDEAEHARGLSGHLGSEERLQIEGQYFFVAAGYKQGA